MTRNADRRIENLQDRIERGEEMSGDDQEVLQAFDSRLALLGSQYGKERREKLLRHCVRIAEEVGGLANALEDKRAAEDIVRWIHDTYDNEESNRDYRVALRMFGKHVSDSDEIPDSISWVSATTSKDYNPMPNPAKMLWWDDHIQPMLNECRHARDKALIAVAWDSGARSGEIRNLTVGDVSDHKYGLRISVDGKKGERSVVLTTAVPYLKQWLNVHPAPEQPDAPLWSKLNKPEDISYQMKLKILKKHARKASITHTDVTFTRMRKSSASYLASDGVNQAHIEDHHGWDRGSKVASRYVAVFGDANDRAIAQAHGVDVEEDESDPIAPVTCPRCGNETPRDEPTCVWCHQALDAAAMEELEKDQRKTRTELLRIARDDPELLDDIERVERFIELADENTEILREAREFASAGES
ncbi:site-specific integrase [Halorhabdus amylolytica]|uniref:site-specific integrase n=1 Tax=Halorhabdus amylolytica TaxID=2559573 RepID=UPI0010AAC3ED|nr:site-specific integrase [Halorhabdus amylolytica]